MANSGEKGTRRRTGARTALVRSGPALDEALAKAQARLPVRSKAELRREIRTLVQEVNLKLQAIGTAHEELALLLLDRLCGGEPLLALHHERAPSAEYLELVGRAGKSLDLTSHELSTHLRVGALLKLLDWDAWHGLDWSKKKALLPLVGADPTLALLRTGIAYAIRPHVGVALVVDWVQANTPRDTGSRGRPRGPTLATGKSIVQAGSRFEPEVRERLVTALRRAEPKVRAAFEQDLEQTIENLASLLEELREDA